ncbi:MAG: NAD(P)/FAD-dependent oxidoreductase [Bilifractor sp.]|jgi:glycine/D-amino acid oxidase-like deaminating enzyme
MQDADVIIIGAGIMGCSIAWQLGRLGKKVLVLERKDVAAGSAGATDGVVGYHTKKPGPELDLAVQSIGMFRTLAEDLGEDIEFDFSSGGLQPAEDEMQFEILSRIAAEQRKSGVDIRMIDGEEARALEPNLAEDIYGALYCPTSGQVNPLKLTMAYAHAAKRLGAVIQTETEVTGFITENGAVKGVRTDRGDFYSDAVVNACGSWAGLVAKMAGMDLPIQPRKGQLAITEPVDFFLKAEVQCALYNIIKFMPEAVKDKRALKLGSSLSIGQTKNGGLLIGSTREFAGFEKENTFDAIEVMMKRAIRFFPALETVDVIRFFSGFRPYTPDGLPMLGETALLRGFYMAAGHEGDGIALSAITGKLIAETIALGKPSYNIDVFSPNRFLE